jgi:hypothetical protein
LRNRFVCDLCFGSSHKFDISSLGAMLEFMVGALVGVAAVLLWSACAACKQRRDVERYKQDYIYPGAMRAGGKKELARRFTSLVDIRGPLHR